MIQVEIEEFQNRLNELMEQVARGETVVVYKESQPVAEVRPYVKPWDGKSPRPLGLAKGMVEILPAFFDPLPQDIQDAFEGKGS